MEQILTTQSQKSRVVQGSNKASESALRQQLEQQDQVKQKLNEHIAYLQNQIRRRDELLDASDFEEDDSALSSDSDEHVNHQLLDGVPADADDELFEKLNTFHSPSIGSRELAQDSDAKAATITGRSGALKTPRESES